MNIKLKSLLSEILQENESTNPLGAIFLNENAVIVGQEHAKSPTLSEETKSKVIKIANKYGAWYEGNGADTKYVNYIKKWKGAFDDQMKIDPNNYVWCYVMFSNVKENNRIQQVGVDEKKTIFEQLMKNQKALSFQSVGFAEDTLKKFLEACSEGKYDLLKMSEASATLENLTKFFTAGERLMWPKNWESYPYKAGKVAKAANDIRDKFLAERTQGAYFVGSGHLLGVKKFSNKEIVP